MFSRQFLKIFLLAALLSPACRFRQTPPDAAASPTPIAVEEIKNRIPFNTKEPETYQAEIVVTANGAENKIFTTRGGANRLTIYDYQTPVEVAVLQTEANGLFLINRGQKIYAENQTSNGGNEVSDEIFPITEIVQQSENAAFEKLPDENGQAKYRAILDGSKNSETVITVDQTINLPVKQEFFSLKDGQKILLTTTELRNFTTQIDARNFEPPKDYKKVSFAEFQEARLMIKGK